MYGFYRSVRAGCSEANLSIALTLFVSAGLAFPAVRTEIFFYYTASTILLQLSVGMASKDHTKGKSLSVVFCCSPPIFTHSMAAIIFSHSLSFLMYI